jgi:hypothetical protein
MLCRLTLTVVLVAVAAASTDAQLVSNPVVTSWPPYTTMKTYALPAAPPVAADVCTPPVVTYYSPAVSRTIVPAPLTSLFAPRTTYRVAVPSCCGSAVPYIVPTTTYYAPVTTYRVPTNSVYYAPPVTVYAPSTTTYYSPLANYRMPAVPTSDVFSVPIATTPVTSYYTPAATAVPVMSAPVTTGRSCGCGGR